MKSIMVRNIGLIATGGLIVVSCGKDPDSPGVEYMPDMYRSPAIEAYIDWGEIRDEQRPELKNKMSALKPPNGTIPYYEDMEKARVNMPLPWKAPYKADETHGLYGWDMYESIDEMDEAKNTIIKDYKNPIPYSDDVVKEGKELFIRMCSQCHGEKGDGKGPIVENGKMSGVANLTAPPNSAGSDGLLFYYMSYGKGIMGAHAMILTREERWKIVHHLRKLQNSDYPNIEVTEPADSANVMTADTTMTDSIQ